MLIELLVCSAPMARPVAGEGISAAARAGLARNWTIPSEPSRRRSLRIASSSAGPKLSVGVAS